MAEELALSPPKGSQRTTRHFIPFGSPPQRFAISEFFLEKKTVEIL
jgi:hypothetical protein